MTRGLFITLEGIEGVGKSTHVATIARWLEATKIPYVLTREPGGTVIGEAIRNLLLDAALPPMSSTTELLLIFAARAEHIAKVIAPALDRGEWVISDRFTDATFAYQGGGRQLPASLIEILQEQVQGSLRPDMTLLLDAPVTVALARAKARSDGDRFEAEREQFFERVRRAYLGRATAEPARFRVIDAVLPLSEVSLQLLRCLEEIRP